MGNFDPQDHYFKRAKKEGYLARSAFKLEEIDQKFHFFNKNTKNIVDIGCAPGSWLQYSSLRMQQLSIKHHTIIGFDLKQCHLQLPNVYTYAQDIQDIEKVQAIFDNHAIPGIDCIISDMAPDTIGHKDADAIRSISLIESTFWIYEQLLVPDGKFAIKVFMGPGFDQLYNELKQQYGGPKRVKLFKPKSCRKESKETYIIRI